jgi:hypothetical protein
MLHSKLICTRLGMYIKEGSHYSRTLEYGIGLCERYRVSTRNDTGCPKKVYPLKSSLCWNLNAVLNPRVRKQNKSGMSNLVIAAVGSTLISTTDFDAMTRAMPFP